VVDLESLASPDQIVDAIISAVSLDHASIGESVHHLTSYLRDKRMLLILDGFERVVMGAHLVSEIAAGCSDVRVLVTSRTRLNVAEEYVLTLEGLSLPPDHGPREDAVHADAVQLVLQRAKKTRLDFEFREPDLDQAVELSRLVGGSPLAIELAMAWVHALSLEDIRAEIESDMGFLEARSQNVPDRHRSLRAVFEGSWRLLGPTAREVLPKLAVFRGGFRREAAAAVAGATLPVLVQLTDASLVSVRPDGRYGLHALIQQFSLEALETAEDVLAETLDAHAAYYRKYTDRVLGTMYADREEDALAMLRNELPNVLAAWERTLASRRDAQLAFPAELVVFFERVGLFQEGRRFFQDAEAELDPSDPRDASWLVEIWANMAWIEYRMGNMARAEDLATKAAQAGGETDRASMIAWNTLGLVSRERDHLAAATNSYERAIEIARARGELNRAAMYNVNLAIVTHELGDLRRAKQLLDDTIETAQQTNYSYLLVNAWNNLAALLEEEGNYAGARDLYTKALDLAEATGYDRMRSLLLANIAEAHLESGDISASSRSLAKAEASVVDGRDELIAALVDDVRGRIQAAVGNFAKAEESYLRGLMRSVEHSNDKRHLKILVHLSELWVEQRAYAKAAWILENVRGRTTTNPAVRQHVDRLLSTISDAAGRRPVSTEQPPDVPPEVVRDLTSGG
jgi:predicted ATPase